ncbi:MAG: hypothetical protein IJO13_02400, partial [Lachnospiraceae bacterium]|nr:hypothetical protein [Lachnospiraceae bacterium]
MKRRAPWSIARLFVLLVLAVVMVSMMGTVAFAQEADNGADKECYLKGDMNADGEFNPDDAIHTLYHAFFGDKDYPIKQDCNVDGDLDIDPDDAIELLYIAFFGDEEGKFGNVVHDYYDPAWSWEETDDGVAATVTVQCACGDKSHSLEADVAKGEAVAATCTAAGSQVYTATVSDDDEIFTSTYTQVIAAAGHTAGEAAYDDNQHYTLCANCGEKLNAASHSWEADGEASAATCKVAAVQNYKCSCGATKSEELGFAEHAYEYVEDVLVEGETCQYAKKHVCADCGEVKLTDQYANHNYVASVKEATCQADGEKVYKCSLCGAVEKTETI